MNPVRSRSSLTRPRLFALLILALALAIRLWDLTARSLWLDEAVEYWVAASPLARQPDIVRDVIQDPPLYSLLLHVWMEVSTGEAWLRLLSVLFGVGTVAGIMAIAYRLQGWASAWVAGLMVSILPSAVRYAQEVGQYAPMLCFIAWSVVALLDFARDAAWKHMGLWLVLSAAGIYTYYGAAIAILVPFACLLVECIVRRDGPRVRRALGVFGSLIVATLPLLLYYLPHQLHRGPTEKAFDPGALNLAASIPAATSFHFTGWPCTRIPGWCPIALLVVVFTIAAPRQRRFGIWLAVLWAFCLLLEWLHLFPSVFRHSMILVPMMLPFMACAVGGDASRVRTAGAALALALLGALSLVSLPNRTIHDRAYSELCAWPETEDVGRVANAWAERGGMNAPTYVYYSASPSFAYYVDRVRGARVSRPGDWFLQCWRGEDAPACRDGLVHYGRWIRSLDPEEKMASVFETLDGNPTQFWLVMSHQQKNETVGMGNLLLKQYAIADQIAEQNATAVLLRRRVP
jgi:hypothetical protein